MNVASEDLSRELHELSGWDDTLYFRYERTDPNSTVPLKLIGNGNMGMTVNNASTGFTVDKYDQLVPAYDLGFLLRRLPLQTRLTRGARGYSALYSNAYTRMPDETPVSAQGKADTPEDAVAKLCIALFKAGLLKQQEPK